MSSCEDQIANSNEYLSEVERLRLENAQLKKWNEELRRRVAVGVVSVSEDVASATLPSENTCVERRNFVLRHRQNLNQLRKVRSASQIDVSLKNILLDSITSKMNMKNTGEEVREEVLDEGVTDQIIESLELFNDSFKTKLESIEQERNSLIKELEQANFMRKAERDVWRYKTEKIRLERDRAIADMNEVKERVAEKEKQLENIEQKLDKRMSRALSKKDDEMREILGRVHQGFRVAQGQSAVNKKDLLHRSSLESSTDYRSILQLAESNFSVSAPDVTVDSTGPRRAFAA